VVSSFRPKRVHKIIIMSITTSRRIKKYADQMELAAADVATLVVSVAVVAVELLVNRRIAGGCNQC
jgi:hypothetical protein